MGIEKEREAFENLWLAGGGNFDNFIFSEDQGKYAAIENSNLTDKQKEMALYVVNNAYLFFVGGFKQAAQAQAVPEWILTSDRMPKEGEEVLVHSLGQVRQVTRDSKWAGGFKERNCYGWQAAYGQSHWMPKSIGLPEEYHFYYKNDANQKAIIEAQE